MRIISSFKDYYDSIQKHGQDRSIVYQREQKDFKLASFPYGTHNYSCFGQDIKSYTIGFCGKLYNVFKVYIHEYDKPSYYKLALTIDEIDEAVNYNTQGKYKHQRKKYYQDDKWGQRRQIVKYIEDFSKLSVTPDVFHKLEGPIFVVYPDRLYAEGNIRQALTKVVVNEQLSKFEFQRLVDPYTAYQELSMFVGGVLKQATKPVPVPDDETLAEIKGFNKYSFRKDKSK